VTAIKVFLADDQKTVLAYLRDELGDKFEIAGTAANGEEAVAEVLRVDPDVLVLDITMPGISGLDVASRLRDVHPRTKILFLTINEQPEYVSAAFSTGARGYVTKRRIASDLAQAIREVFEGETYLSPILRA
jgi:DNA-binding NarL/FixJ family response regulator